MKFKILSVNIFNEFKDMLSGVGGNFVLYTNHMCMVYGIGVWIDVYGGKMCVRTGYDNDAIVAVVIHPDGGNAGAT